VNTTAIAYGQKISRSLMILVVCNSSCVHKHHAFASSDPILQNLYNVFDLVMGHSLDMGHLAITVSHILK